MAFHPTPSFSTWLQPATVHLYVGFLNTLTGFVLLLSGTSGLIKDLLGIKVLILVTLLAHAFSLYLVFKIKKNRSA